MIENMDNKIIKLLMPVVAIIIIFESIVLVSNLEKNSNNNIVVNEVTPTITTTEKKTAFDINFSTDETQLKVGKKYKVSVNLMPKDNYNLNALDLFVKYDPATITISNLVSAKELETPDLIKISDKKNVVALNYLFTAKDGMIFTKDKLVTVLTFTMTPKTSGNSNLEISTGDANGDSVTMLVDKSTSKSLLFTSNKLDLLLTK
jgi:hypothetical protein